MKHLHFLFVFAMLFLMASCEKEEPGTSSGTSPEPPQGSIVAENPEDKAPQFDAEGGSKTFTFTTNADWTSEVSIVQNRATGSDDEVWCSINPSSGKAGKSTVTISIAPNKTDAVRQANITITCGKATYSIPVTQQAGETEPNFADEPYFEQNYWSRTELQKLGFRGKVKSWYEKAETGTFVNYDVYEYDEKGNLVKDIYYEDGKVESVITYTYDSQNHLVQEKGSTYVTTYEYKNADKKVAVNSRWGVADYIHRDIMLGLSSSIKIQDCGDYYQYLEQYYTFDADGNLNVHVRDYPANAEGEKIGNWGDDYTYTVIYKDGYPYSSTAIKSTEYYPNGMYKKVVEKSYEAYGMTITEATTCYLENKHVMLCSSYDAGSNPYPNYTTHYWSKCTYNDNHDVLALKSAYYGADMEYNNTYSDYKYDAHGNWIERTEVIEPIFQHGEFFTNKRGRAIEYHK